MGAHSGTLIVLPAAVLDDARIGHAAFRVLAALSIYADDGGWCWPSSETIANRLGVTPAAVRQRMGELVELGYLDVERVKSGRGERPARKRLTESARGVSSANDPALAHVTSRVSSANTERTQRTDNGERELFELTSPMELAGARAAGKGKRIGGKVIPSPLWDLTVAALEHFNVGTGRHLGAVTGTGKPSEAAKRIAGRVVEHPELGLEQHRTIIDRTLASRWWGDDWPPAPGVVYGPKVFETNVDRPATSNGGGRHTNPVAAREARHAKRKAAARRVWEQHEREQRV